MATSRKRWPVYAEWARADSLAAAAAGIEKLKKAQRNLETADERMREDPEFARLAVVRAQARVAEALAEFQAIEIKLNEVRNGTEA